MTKKKINQDIQDIINIISNNAGCGIQHNDCPCNTCFHTWASDVGLSDTLGHLLWGVVLAMRGDYKEEDIYEQIVEDLSEVIKK